MLLKKTNTLTVFWACLQHLFVDFKKFLTDVHAIHHKTLNGIVTFDYQVSTYNLSHAMFTST